MYMGGQILVFGKCQKRRVFCEQIGKWKTAAGATARCGPGQGNN